MKASLATTAGLSLLVAVVSVGLYSNTLGHGFVWDDSSAIVNNKDVKPEQTDLHDVWSNDYWGTPMDSVESHKSFRPLTIMSFRWNYARSGLASAVEWHAVNVAAHALASVLLLLVLLEALEDVELAATAALLFATHPVHVEAVANLANGRAETLCAVGVFGCVWCQLRIARFAPKPNVPDAAQPGWRTAGMGWRVLGLLFYLFASLTKEIGLTAVGITTAYDALALSGALSGIYLVHLVLAPFRMLGLKPVAALVQAALPAAAVGELAKLEAARKAASGKKGGKKSAAAAAGDDGAPGAWAVCWNRNMLLWAGAAAVLVLRKHVSGDSAMPEIPWRDRPAQFVKDPVLRQLSNLYYNAEHLKRMLWPSFLSAESGWAAMKPIGTHGSVADPRLVFPFLSVLAILAVGVRALVGTSVAATAAAATADKGGDQKKKKKKAEAEGDAAAAAPVATGATEGAAVQRARSDLMGVLLLLVPFVPSMGLIAVPGFAVAERVLYTPLAGFCVLLALFARSACPRWWLRAPLLLGVLCAYSYRAWIRNPVWATNAALWEEEYNINPDCCHVRVSKGYHAIMGYDYHADKGVHTHDPAKVTKANLVAALKVNLEGLELCSEDLDGYEMALGYAKLLHGIGEVEEAKKAITDLRAKMAEMWARRRKDLAWSTVCETDAGICAPTYPMDGALAQMLAQL